LIMAAGFVLLLFSGFTPTFQLGLMATFAIFAALFADLVILPLLLSLYDRTSLSSPLIGSKGLRQGGEQLLPPHSRGKDGETC